MKRLIVTCILYLLCYGCYGQGYDSLDRKARMMADTANFSPNQAGEWQLYNSFLKRVAKDSVAMELIVRHAKNLDFKEYQFIGTITSKNLIPRGALEMPFFVVTDEYRLKIEANGRCYLKLVTGSLPPQDPVIIPLFIKYRRS